MRRSTKLFEGKTPSFTSDDRAYICSMLSYRPYHVEALATHLQGRRTTSEAQYKPTLGLDCLFE